MELHGRHIAFKRKTNTFDLTTVVIEDRLSACYLRTFILRASVISFRSLLLDTRDAAFTPLGRKAPGNLHTHTRVCVLNAALNRSVLSRVR